MLNQFIDFLLHRHKDASSNSENMQETENSNTLDWKKWQGQVLGSEGDIKKALTKIGKEPGNATELQKIMDANRREEMEATAKETKHTFY